jgi:glutamine amidotransferase
MIAIVDYGAGNLRSVENAVEAAGARYEVVRDPGAVARSEKIVLPGVGHFGQMIRSLDALGLREPLVQKIRGGTPFLGICLGAQALFQASEEAPEARGLGIFAETVRRFPAGARVPHMGWNSLEGVSGRLLDGAGKFAYVYFAHSYYMPVTNVTSSRCEYCLTYTASIESGNIFGVQFHPEKSGPLGLRIVKNFVEL